MQERRRMMLPQVPNRIINDRCFTCDSAMFLVVLASVLAIDEHQFIDRQRASCKSLLPQFGRSDGRHIRFDGGGLGLRSFVPFRLPGAEEFLILAMALRGTIRPEVDSFSMQGNDSLLCRFVERIFGWSVKESRHHISPFARSQKGMFTGASPVAFPFCAEI